MKKLFLIGCVIASMLLFVGCEKDELGGNYGKVMLNGVDIAGVWVNVESPDNIRYYWTITDDHIEYYEADKAVSYRNGYVYGDAEWTLEQYHEYELIGNALFVQGIKSAVLDVVDSNTIEIESNWLVSGTCKRVKSFSDKPVPESVIAFEDKTTKELCLAYWDENRDGYLTYDEAASVADIGSVFKHSVIKSFKEFAYFKMVSVIPKDAFNSCTQLEYITIPDSVAAIEDGAFGYCYALKSISIPNSVVKIGNNVFQSCSGNLTINSKVIEKDVNYRTSEVSSWLYGSRFTSVTFGKDITKIGQGAFWHYATLKSISIPNSVVEIGTRALSECFVLEDISIPNSVKTIGELVFAYSRNVKSIKFPDGDYSVGYGPTFGCASLERMTGKYTTSDNRALIIDGKLVSIATGNISTYKIPNTVTTIERYLYRGFEREGWLESFSGRFATADGKCLIEDNVLKAVAPKNMENFTIPEGVTKIYSYILYNCGYLMSVTIPKSVTSIERGAFYDCDLLQSVYCKPTIPPTIETKVFDDNAVGRKIYVPTESVNAYKSAKYWKDYADYIVGYDFE